MWSPIAIWAQAPFILVCCGVENMSPWLPRCTEAHSQLLTLPKTVHNKGLKKAANAANEIKIRTMPNKQLAVCSW